jgi:hypothetical protein
MLEIVDSISTITRRINEALAIEINRVLQNNQSNIRNKIVSLIPQWLNQQSAFISLQSNDASSLAGYFGIPPSQVGLAVDAITSSVANSTEVTLKKFDKNLKGGLQISVQPSDFQNLLSLSAGHVVYAKGDLHWLNWLLTRGSAPIIQNYEYEAKSGTGRSGLGTMTIGSSFRVPSDHAGTIENNCITQALSGKENEIINILKSVLL